MEIKIGIVDVARELTIDVADSAQDVIASYGEQLKRENGLMRLSDAKGRLVLIPAARIAYIDLGSPEHRPVGFGAPEK